MIVAVVLVVVVVEDFRLLPHRIEVITLLGHQVALRWQVANDILGQPISPHLQGTRRPRTTLLLGLLNPWWWANAVSRNISNQPRSCNILKEQIPQPPACLIMDSPIFHLTRLQARQVVWFHPSSLQSNHLSEAVELAARNNNKNHSYKYNMAF